LPRSSTAPRDGTVAVWQYTPKYGDALQPNPAGKSRRGVAMLS